MRTAFRCSPILPFLLCGWVRHLTTTTTIPSVGAASPLSDAAARPAGRHRTPWRGVARAGVGTVRRDPRGGHLEYGNDDASSRRGSPSSSRLLAVGVVVMVGSSGAPKATTGEGGNYDGGGGGQLFPWWTAPSSASALAAASSTVLFVDGGDVLSSLASPSAILRISHDQQPRQQQAPLPSREGDVDGEPCTDDEEAHADTVESLALLCDAILLVILPPSPSSSATERPSSRGHSSTAPVVSALARGMERRSRIPSRCTTAAGPDKEEKEEDGRTLLGRGRLFVATPWAVDDADDDAWVRHVVQTDLAPLSPAQLRAAEFRTLSDLSKDAGWGQILATDDHDGSSRSSLAALFPEEASYAQSSVHEGGPGPTGEELFAGLLRAVIQSKSGAAKTGATLPLTLSMEYPNVKDETANDGADGASPSGTTEIGTETPPLAAAEMDVNEAVVQEVLRTAHSRLEALEAKMDDRVLQSEDSPAPLLEFGTLAQEILRGAETRLQQLREDGLVSPAICDGLMQRVGKEAERLYKVQVQALRDCYGQRYEAMIVSLGEGQSVAERDRGRAAAAEHVTSEFVAAARNAVPAMYRDTESKRSGGGGVDFDHVDAFQGLLQDMMEVTQRLEDEECFAEMLVDEDKSEGSAGTATSKWKRRIPKWLERIAARAVVFGVNYFQGWLAWQGIKRAALERDRTQPKFPLF